MFAGVLLHLGYNMWADHDHPSYRARGCRSYVAQPHLRFDEPLWREILQAMSEGGLNAVVIDLGEGVAYKSHPELGAEGAWTPAKLKDELQRCRDLGLEPLPKLNFSTCHDHWLGPYARMVSTPVYYGVCRDLIAEVCELFDGPRLFHLGMDEETAAHQRNFLYAVMRQGALWWDDLGRFVEHVRKGGSRAWVWSDKIWHCGREEFAANMPREVVQSNWYYAADFSLAEDFPLRTRLQAFLDLDELGYEQIPTGSNWTWRENILQLRDWCGEHLAPERLMGFLQTPWHPTIEHFRYKHLDAVEALRQAMAGERI
jgi:hypothetical protein